jgi:hypothetical protein
MESRLDIYNSLDELDQMWVKILQKKFMKERWDAFHEKHPHFNENRGFKQGNTYGKTSRAVAKERRGAIADSPADNSWD